MTAEVALLPAPDRAGATAWTTAWVTAELSRHERKKLATRAALSNAARSLTVEHGLDSVTPEAVAAAVDVPPRTFRGHFATREEPILDGLARRAVSLLGTVRDRPVGEPVWDSLDAALPDLLHDAFALLRAGLPQDS